MQIWCPGCEWKPKPSTRWVCERRCRHEWNTFDTGGVCPACSKVWELTQCHACHRKYPHPDWYHDDPVADGDTTDETSSRSASADDWDDWERELESPSTSPASRT